MLSTGAKVLGTVRKRLAPNIGRSRPIDCITNCWNSLRSLCSAWRSSCSCWNWNSWMRSEEHTSELQSRPHLVCRLLLEKKKNYIHGDTCTVHNCVQYE